MLNQRPQSIKINSQKVGRKLAFIEMMPLKYDFLVSYPLDTHHDLHLVYVTNSSVSVLFLCCVDVSHF